MRRLLLGILLCAACGDDETTVVDVGPTGPPSIELGDPASSAPEPPCLEIGAESDARASLLCRTRELLLRPPGACGGIAQCGHLALRADGTLNNEGATPVIELLARKLADRYHDGETHLGTGAPDLLTLRVEVIAESGEPLLDHEGKELFDEVAVVTAPSCR
jgi:hypothetical protein